MKHVIRWHRYFGLTIVFFVIVLAVTGMLLNHTEALALSQRHTSNPLLMKLYGIPAPTITAVFKSENHTLLVGKQHVLLDGKEIPIRPPVYGMVFANGVLLIAGETGISLVSQEGELIDLLRSPAPVRKIGASRGHIVIESNNRHFQIDAAMTQLMPIVDDAHNVPSWSRPEKTSDDERSALATQLPRNSIPIERVVLDLHSGRLFGFAGVILFDFVALAMIVLSGSGLWMWLWRTRRKTARNKGKTRTNNG